MQIIGIAGRAGSGKSEVAEYVRGKIGPDLWRVAFADELKRLARRGFGWDGIKDAKGRRLLQVLGTDCGRAYNPQIWIQKWRDRVEMVTEWGATVIMADDVRFENEAAEIHRMGGVVVRVVRPELDGTKPDGHISEWPIPEFCIDYTILNDGNLEQLRGQVDILLREIGKDGE